MPFDFIEFAENVAGSYEVIDVWGQKRDIRDAEIILTESMLKLWDSYSSWEEYENNCIANGYLFSATKTAPTKLEDVRTSNYQFLNPYNFSDEEIKQLCAPTLDEIKNIMRLNPNYTMLYLTGEKFQNFEDWQKVDNAIVKALQYEPEWVICDLSWEYGGECNNQIAFNVSGYSSGSAISDHPPINILVKFTNNL